MISSSLFSLLIYAALVLALLCPILLVILFVRDHIKGKLW